MFNSLLGKVAQICTLTGVVLLASCAETPTAPSIQIPVVDRPVPVKWAASYFEACPLAKPQDAGCMRVKDCITNGGLLSLALHLQAQVFCLQTRLDSIKAENDKIAK